MILLMGVVTVTGDKPCTTCGGTGMAPKGMFDPTLGAKEAKELVQCKKCNGKGWVKE